MFKLLALCCSEGRFEDEAASFRVLTPGLIIFGLLLRSTATLLAYPGCPWVARRPELLGLLNLEGLAPSSDVTFSLVSTEESATL